jgi:hypothetical protein
MGTNKNTRGRSTKRAQADRRKLPENVTDRVHTSYGERTKETAANAENRHKK